jgi:uncharacterized protein with gpF-like domain
MRKKAAGRALAAVRPNAGIEAKYRGQLDALIDEMQKSIAWWIKAAYRAKPPKMAQDASEDGGAGSFYGMSPARAMQAAMKDLRKRWERRFDEAAPELARYFATKVKDRADGALTAILKKAGFAIEFKLTATMNDVLQATIAENVSLIRSIAAEHLTEVEGLVMRSVQQGRDLGYLSQELQARYGITKRRAALVSRDQNNKATAAITRVRHTELGIAEAEWKHSGAGKHPRPSHLKADRDGVVYKVSEGWYDPDVGKRIWPGELINCRCVARPIIPGLSR